MQVMTMEEYYDSHENDNTNPFTKFLKTPGLDMLNSALPYVSQPMRKPLALYIKYAEIQRIMEDFDQEELLSACGFQPNNADPESMLKAMKMASGGQPTPQIDSLLNMIQMMRSYQTFNEFMQNNPELMHFLSSMMNQKNAFAGTDSTSSQNAENAGGFPGQAGGINPMELLKQFSTSNGSDNPMILLQELLKNNNLSR